MQSILNIFKSRYFWIGFGFVLLIALTLILGWWLGWSMVTQLLIVIGVLLVCIGIVVFEFVRARRSAQQIEESIKMQAEQQRKQSRPDKQPEIEELQERLEEAIAKLKNSNLGRGRRGSNALYALPWYMMIGPPGAGKTTAIKNSGLNFPVGTDRVQGVGGTRNCDWFFTDQAILLDTAGRYMTEREDEEEWHAFLDMLKEHRTDRPINGILVGISIDELMDATPDEIEWHANNIRRRISELVEQLGVRFPVYLVFTKCDLMQGFVEFFGDMTRQERDQIWGCTLTEDQREEGNLRTVFEHEFDLLYDALIDARSERLSRSMKREDRRRVYVFPLEFASAKENLSLFVDQLFQQNPYQENPEFRGFYFTSGTQEGAPIDHVIQSISEEFDFASGVEGNVEPDREKKSYFIKDLFTDVVIPDQYLVEQTTSSARRGRFKRWGVGAAAAVLLALFVVGLSQALVRSQLDLNQAEEAAQAAASVQWTGQGSADLEPLNQLRREIVRLEDYEDDPPFMRWGLYQGGEVLEPTRSLYYQKLRPLVRDHFKALEQRLDQRDVSALNKEERRTLRAELENYLLLSDSSSALDRQRFREQLSAYLTDQMTQGGASVAAVNFQGRQGQVEQHVNAFVEGLRQQRVQPFPARSALVERLVRAVQRPPTIDRIYTRIKRQGQNAVPAVALTDILGRGQKGLSLFASRPTISGFFTKQGWENFVEEEIQEAAQTPGQGGLIDGSSAQLSEELRDSDKVAKQLRKRYFAEYTTAWKRFLNELQYKSFGGIRATAQNLQVLGSEFDSPLLRILARATQETTFESTVSEAVQGVQEEAERQAQKTARSAGVRGDVVGGSETEEGKNLHPVTSQMQWLHRLEAIRGESGNASKNMKQALDALRAVGAKLDGIQNDPKQAFDFAKRVLEDNGGILDRQRRVLRDALSQFPPQARQELFVSPILEGWRSVLNETQRYLNERWRRNVYQYYQSNLAGKYPFGTDSDEDAQLRHVQTFFQPQKGIVHSFVENRLGSFLREDENRPRTWQGEGISFSTAAARLLEKADVISEELVRGGSLGWTFVLQPEVPATEGEAPSPGQVFARIHGTSLPYEGGLPEARRTEFVWPGDPGALLRIQTNEGPLGPKQWEGPWAWFRMLDEAQVEPQTGTTYRLRWRFPHPSGRYTITARYTLQSETASTLITQKPSGFFRFSVPETLGGSP